METKATSSRMNPLLDLYDMQTTFFSNAIEGITDKDAHNRLNTKANHISWLTGSLVEQRYEIAKTLGSDDKQEAHDLFKNNQGIQDGVTYPSLLTFKKDWERITPVLRNALHTIKDEKLGESFEIMSGIRMTYYELISFIIYREANCIGQIALWRRLLGYAPMKYQ